MTVQHRLQRLDLRFIVVSASTSHGGRVVNFNIAATVVVFVVVVVDVVVVDCNIVNEVVDDRRRAATAKGGNEVVDAPGDEGRR